MSHLIPPLVSNSPPPMVPGGADDLDDEFGDFAVPEEITFDGYSLPSSPLHIPNSCKATRNSPSDPEQLHINSREIPQNKIAPDKLIFSSESTKTETKLTCDNDINNSVFSVSEKLVPKQLQKESFCETSVCSAIKKCDFLKSETDFDDFTSCTDNSHNKYSADFKSKNCFSQRENSSDFGNFVSVSPTASQINGTSDDFGEFETCHTSTAENGKTNTENVKTETINSADAVNVDNITKFSSNKINLGMSGSEIANDNSKNSIKPCISNALHEQYDEVCNNSTINNEFNEKLEANDTNFESNVSMCQNSFANSIDSLKVDPNVSTLNKTTFDIQCKNEEEHISTNSIKDENCTKDTDNLFQQNLSPIGQEQLEENLSKNGNSFELNENSDITQGLCNTEEKKSHDNCQIDNLTTVKLSSDQNYKLTTETDSQESTFNKTDFDDCEKSSPTKSENCVSEKCDNNIELSNLEQEDTNTSETVLRTSNENVTSAGIDNYDINVPDLNLKLDTSFDAEFTDFESVYNNSAPTDSEYGEFESGTSNLKTNDNLKEICDDTSNENKHKVKTHSVNKNDTENYDSDSKSLDFTKSDDASFSSFKLPNVIKNTDTNLSSDSDFDFDDFKSSDVNKSEDADYNDFKSTDKKKNDEFGYDDFGDFSDYSSQPSTSDVKLSYDKHEILCRAEEVIKNIFPFKSTDFPDCVPEDFTDNSIFEQLKIIENTNALNYHWNNSESQKGLLKSLNIDSRNILYGPRWNPMMPKYASNLGFEPLEPQKSDLPLSASTNSTQADNSQANVEVPDAKFDWTSSGLVNPLDCSPDDLLLDLEQLVTSLELVGPATSSCFLNATSTLSPPTQSVIQQSPEANIDLLDSWDQWLRSQLNNVKKESNTTDEKLSDSCTFKLPNTDILSLQSETITASLPHSDTESVNSLKFTVTDVEADLKLDVDNQSTDTVTPDDEFTDFESCKPEPETNWSSSTLTPVQLPLRETHISLPSETTLEPGTLIDEGNWLGSTINTPEMPRKAEVIEENDEFADFQTAVPPKVETKALEPLKPIVLQPMVVNVPTTINWPEPGVVDDAMLSVLDLKYSKSSADNDDDWSDFVSVPKAETQPKDDFFAAMQTSSNFSNFLQNITNLPSTQLELSVPNLQNTQLHYSALPPMQAPTLNSSGKMSPNIAPSTQQIAAQQIQPGYQPPYQIQLNNTPVNMTQYTLEPTEIGPPPSARKTKYSQSKVRNAPANLSLISSPKNESSIKTAEFDMNVKSNKNKIVNIKPSPVSSDMSFFSPKKETFASQIVSQDVQPVQLVESTFLQMRESSLPANDDDDWSDFVCNQNIEPQSNGWSLNQPKNNILKPSPTWSAAVTPNIITNPVHFDVFQSYQSSTSQENRSKKSGNIFTSSKSSVPNVSTLPEPDFIAPKSKFFTKK